MDALKWSPTFDTGIEVIDRDHRNLFALAEAVRDGVGKQYLSPTAATVQQFIKAATKHFVKEEKILTRVGFPDLDAHKVYHALLMAKAEELRHVCEIEKDADRATACYNELIAFLIDDVVRGDSQFKSYVSHRGLADR